MKPLKPVEPDPDLFDRDGLEPLLVRAEGDPAASEELDFLADLVAAAELEHARLERRPAPPRIAPGPRPRPSVLVAAASVLLLLALGAWLVVRGDGRSTQRSLAQAGPPPFLAAELRTPGEPDDSFARVMEPYTRAEWSAAAAALEEWLRQRSDHGPAHFYLAAAREQLGELAAAEEHYVAASRAPDALLADDARFRLAQLRFRRGDLAGARTELEALAAGAGELARNAREALAELEEDGR